MPRKLLLGTGRSVLGVLGLCLFACGLGGCPTAASRVPLGGVHVEEATLAPRAEPSAAAALPRVEPDAEVADAAAEVKTDTPAAAPVSTKDAPRAAAAPLAFEPRPRALHQTWTRLFDLEFDIKVGPGANVDMKMASHQEARFEVLGVTGGVLDKLGIEYVEYKSQLTVMGATQDSPEELAGKRFVITFAGDKPDVRDASGGTPPKKQVDSVKDDAREPLEIDKALKELAQLAAKTQGRADFSRAGAVALAGGEDDDTKVPSAKATLLKLGVGPQGEKNALIDLSYTLTNLLDDKSMIEVQVSGNLTVLDAPGRYQTSTLQGPMELRSPDPSGMQGRGTIKVTTSYKY
jgi:hypothetical protein